jgi:hypothetical protein
MARRRGEEAPTEILDEEEQEQIVNSLSQQDQAWNSVLQVSEGEYAQRTACLPGRLPTIGFLLSVYSQFLYFFWEQRKCDF